MDRWLGELRYDFDANLSYSPFSSSVVCAHHGRRDSRGYFVVFDLNRNGTVLYVYERTTKRSHHVTGHVQSHRRFYNCFTFVVSLASPVL
jgi:hypothetical protein